MVVFKLLLHHRSGMGKSTYGNHFFNTVIVGGGDDISPELYGGDLIASAVLDPARDELEKCLVEEAMVQGKPVLGICRGAQMINVALGGDLHQDAYDHYNAHKHTTLLPKKDVRVEPGSRLGALAGLAPMRVNALHSQAVDRLGDGLRVAARDGSGVVQAVERVEEPFALGVQWHPEYLTYAHRQRALFRALVAAARASHEHRAQLLSHLFDRFCGLFVVGANEVASCVFEDRDGASKR